MTDKQIIIDGVDESGCPHLIEDYQWWNVAGREEHDRNICALSFDEYIDFEEDDFCKQNPNCYYKQLKRAEKTMQEIWDRFGKTSDELLRKEQEIDQLKAENKHLNDLLNQALKDYEKVRETLTDIKEIAEHCIKQDICTTCDNSNKCHIEDEEIPTYDVCKLILQKTSEVIE